jgi:hypothetical protein
MTTRHKAITVIMALGLTVLFARAEETARQEADASAQEQVRNGLGVGIIVGEPTGISTKKWITDKAAIDAVAAWSFADFDSFQIHVDYLLHNYDLIKTKDLPGSFAVYYGVGGRIKLKGSNEGKGKGSNDEDARFGVRIPLGISYVFKESPVELFSEVVPILDVVPETKFGLSLGLGARYYFNLK